MEPDLPPGLPAGEGRCQDDAPPALVYDPLVKVWADATAQRTSVGTGNVVCEDPAEVPANDLNFHCTRERTSVSTVDAIGEDPAEALLTILTLAVHTAATQKLRVLPTTQRRRTSMLRRATLRACVVVRQE